MNVFLEKQLALFPFSGSIYRSTWRLVTPPRVQVTVDTPVTSRELFRESVMQHRDIFAHFISQIKHICNFNIASHCSFDSINYACTRVVQLGYSEFVCGLGLRPPPIMCGLTSSPGPQMPPSSDLRRAIRDYCDGTRLTKCIVNYPEDFSFRFCSHCHSMPNME